MSSTFNSAPNYTQGFGSSPSFPPVQSPVAPASNNIIGPNGPFPLGQFWVNTTDASIWGLAGLSTSNGVTSATWVGLGGGSSGVDTINNNAPVGGNYTLAGTAAQVAVAQSAGTTTFSLTGPYTPATYTSHGVLVGAGAASITALAVGATDSVLQGTTGANPAFTTTPTVATLTTTGLLTAGNAMIATTGNITATTGDIVSTNGKVQAQTTVSAGTSITASSGAITATLGDFIATNGNLRLNTAGNKLFIHATTAASDALGKGTLNGSGTVTISTTACTVNSLIFCQIVTPSGAGSPGVLSVPSASIGAGSFVVNSSVGADASTFFYFIVN